MTSTPEIQGERSTIGRVFYPAYMAIMGVVYGFLALSWLTTSTASREAGTAWLAPWFTGDVVGIMWLVAMIAAFVAAYLRARYREHTNLLLVCSTVVMLVPLLLALIFAVSSFGFILDPAMLPVSNGKGWITAVSYGGYALLSAWAYLTDAALPKTRR